MDDITIAGMSLQDFHSKCSNSIFYVDGELFQLQRVSEGEPESYDEDGEPIYGEPSIEGSVIDGDGNWSMVLEDDLEEFASRSFDFTFPVCGYVNHNTGATYIQRNVDRQWKIGYNSRNILVKDCFEQEREKLDLVINTGSARFINALFNPFYYEWRHALALVDSGKAISAAISQHVCIGRSMYFSDTILVYKNIPVGYHRDGKWYLFETASYVQKILPFNCIIKEDLSDVIIRSEWD